MLTRTLHDSVTFRRPFRLASSPGLHPAGIYSVDAEEELLEGLSFPVYRRVSTMLVLATPGPSGTVQALMVDAKELAAAIAADGG